MIDVTTAGAAKVLIFPGELDESAAREAREKVHAMLDDGNRVFMCNLSATEKTTSAGLGVMASLWKEVHGAEGEIGFFFMQPEVRTAFAQAGLAHMYHYYDSDEKIRVKVLKNLAGFFADYGDIRGIRIGRGDEGLRIDVFLEFEKVQTMAKVQQSINRIKAALEESIGGSEVWVIPTDQRLPELEQPGEERQG